MKPAFQCVLAAALVLSSAQALALFRCGNVFQDKPCESGPEIRLSPSGRPITGPAPTRAPAAPAAAALPAPAAAGPAPNFAVVCARVGDQAQRMVWKREGGVSQEQQLAERSTTLSAGEHAKAVRDVYARRGTAPEIKAALEAQCVTDRQKEFEASEMLALLRKQAGETGTIAAAPAAPAAAPGNTVGADNAQASPALAGTKPSAARCKGLRQSIDDANSRLRQGGSGRTMESLQNERRDAEASLRSAGC